MYTLFFAVTHTPDPKRPGRIEHASLRLLFCDFARCFDVVAVWTAAMRLRAGTSLSLTLFPEGEGEAIAVWRFRVPTKTDRWIANFDRRNPEIRVYKAQDREDARAAAAGESPRLIRSVADIHDEH